LTFPTFFNSKSIIQLNLSQCLCSFKTRTRETARASERNDEASMRVGDLAVFSEASRDSVIVSGLLAIDMIGLAS